MEDDQVAPVAMIPVMKQRPSCADKNDALGWTSGFSIDFQGLKLGVRTNENSLLERLRSFVPREASPTDQADVDILLSLLVGEESRRRGIRNLHIVYDAWVRQVRTQDLEEALSVVKSTLRLRLATFTTQSLFVSATLMSWKDRGVVILGGSSQRDSLAGLLNGVGATLLCQDFAGVDGDGLLGTLDQPNLALVPSHVFLCNPLEATEDFRDLTSGELAMGLSNNAAALRLDPRRALNAIGKLAASTRGCEVAMPPNGQPEHAGLLSSLLLASAN